MLYLEESSHVNWVRDKLKYDLTLKDDLTMLSLAFSELVSRYYTFDVWASFWSIKLGETLFWAKCALGPRSPQKQLTTTKVNLQQVS